MKNYLMFLNRFEKKKLKKEKKKKRKTIVDPILVLSTCVIFDIYIYSMFNRHLVSIVL